MRKILRHAPLMALLAVTLLLTQIVAVSASPGLEVDQNDTISYELKEVASDMNYFNLTGDTTGFLTPINISVGDNMTCTLGRVTDDTFVSLIEAYEPANNFSNTYEYEATDMFDAVFYYDPLSVLVTGEEVPWYYTWFAYNAIYGNGYSHMRFVPWVLTPDWNDHEDSWMDFLAWELENSSFVNVTITADVDDDTSFTYTNEDDEEETVDTITFTMQAVWNSSKDLDMGTTDEFEGKIAYFVQVEYDKGSGQAVIQNITMTDMWNELENGAYSSVNVLWEYVESDSELGPRGMPLLFIAIPIIVVVAAVAVYLVMKK